jgi:N-acetylmuramoyl-L-alanine amidase
MKKVCVLLDAGHCKLTPGKQSPDASLKEYLYNREIVKGIEEELDKLGIDHWNTHPEENYAAGAKNDSKDLVIRTDRVNMKHRDLKRDGITSFLISVHVNAAGNGSVWYSATGWSAWTTKGKTVSDKLAECMYDAAEETLKPLGKSIRSDKSDGDRDYESNFWILKHSNCACILTENFFMDNKADVEFLLSDEGKKAIIDLHVKGILNYIESL